MNLKVVDVSSTSITVSWSEPEMPNSQIQGYFLTIHNPDIDYTKSQNLSYNYTMFTFDELMPDDEHVIVIYAYAHDPEDDVTLNGTTTITRMRTDIGGVCVRVCVFTCMQTGLVCHLHSSYSSSPQSSPVPRPLRRTPLHRQLQWIPLRQHR